MPLPEKPPALAGGVITRHRFLVHPDQVQGTNVVFSTQQWHQIERVLRLRAGDSVLVFDGVNLVDSVVVLTGSGRGRVEGTRPQAAEPNTQLVVYPALLQRDKFEVVLQKLTEIGAAAIVPVLTARGLVRAAPDEHRETRWRSIVREATEQCGRGVVPNLLPTQPFSEAVIKNAPGTVIVAYEGERRRSLKSALRGAGATVSLFVGPEGGYEPTEATCAAAAGAHLITLGPRILRTETASPMLAALVLYELGDLSSTADQ
jgi:16S rRNA (uracil1498-N3)-methyltransferase